MAKSTKGKRKSPEQREAHKRYMRVYYRANLERMQAYSRTRKARIRKSATRYGLSLADTERIMQEAHCAICGAAGTDIDHSHSTGKVRGKLCHSCNAGLAHFRDNPYRMQRAIAYLVQPPFKAAA